MRALIMHRSKRFMRGLRKQLAHIDSGVETTEWDTEQRGFPKADFGWVTYDVLFCECGSGAANDMFARVLSRLPKIMHARVVGISIDRDLYAAVDAIHLGAGDVLIENELESDRLAAVVERVLNPVDDTQTVEIQRLRHKAESYLLALDPIHELMDELSLHNPRLIGQGGMSKLYLAWSPTSKVPVVVKILRKQSKHGENRYRRMMLEGHVATALNSMHVVDILDFGECDRYAYLMMEFLPGGDLKERIEVGMSPKQSVDVTVELCQALDALAAQGIVHRDIKPSNVMFRSDGTAVLIDFGIAKSAAVDLELTSYGESLGTPRYMSPEQIDNLPVDIRSDIYSLGLTFYEMLVGQPARRSRALTRVLREHLEGDTLSLPEGLSQFDSVLARMTCRDPADRFQSGAEAASVLTKLQVPEWMPGLLAEPGRTSA